MNSINSSIRKWLEYDSFKIVQNNVAGSVRFGCYMKDIDRCIGNIFEKNMLRIEETCKYHIIAGGRRVSYDITAVNLTVIITMAFQVMTPEAKTLRMWFVEQFAKMKYLDVPIFDIGQNFLLN